MTNSIYISGINKVFLILILYFIAPTKRAQSQMAVALLGFKQFIFLVCCCATQNIIMVIIIIF